MTRLLLATRNAGKLAELQRLLRDRRPRGGGRRPARRRRLPGGAGDRGDVRRERAAQGARGGAVHRPAGGRRRLGADRGRAQRDARRAVGALVGPARGRRRRTPRCCWASSPTCPTSGGARRSSARPRSSPPTAPSRCWSGSGGARVVREKRGTNGFGYDPVFVPEGLDVTSAELDPGGEGRAQPPRPGVRRAGPGDRRGPPRAADRQYCRTPASRRRRRRRVAGRAVPGSTPCSTCRPVRVKSSGAAIRTTPGTSGARCRPPGRTDGAGVTTAARAMAAGSHEATEAELVILTTSDAARPNPRRAAPAPP